MKNQIMKRKKFKIQSKTLFVYRGAKSFNGFAGQTTTDPTTTMTTTTTATTGIFQK